MHDMPGWHRGETGTRVQGGNRTCGTNSRNMISAKPGRLPPGPSGCGAPAAASTAPSPLASPSPA